MLNTIFEHKRTEVELAKAEIPLAEVRRLAEQAGPTRGFLKALQSAETPLALIAEVKKASPSQGVIRADFDAVSIAKTYTDAGAHALSVLTDKRYFQGSPEYLSAIREATHLPLLRKDFICDPYQVFEARAWGADAILLIVASLEQPLLRGLYNLSLILSLDVLVEVHSQEEAERALDLGAPLIGVNNRDLGTFKTDLAISEKLIPQLTESAFVVSESALSTPADLARVANAGARGVLIGTTFCGSPDIKAKVLEVMEWPEPERSPERALN